MISTCADINPTERSSVIINPSRCDSGIRRRNKDDSSVTFAFGTPVVLLAAIEGRSSELLPGNINTVMNGTCHDGLEDRI